MPPPILLDPSHARADLPTLGLAVLGVAVAQVASVQQTSFSAWCESLLPQQKYQI
jgi:hypothetical protein